MPLDFERSFAPHEKAKYWSSKNDKKPEEVHLNSRKKFWFDCDKCGHEFEIALSNIALKDQWCSYCTNKRLCKNDCDKCYNKSFASHEKAKYWSNKNILSARETFKYSNTEGIFECNICNHTFTAKIVNIVFDKWCPYCSNRKLCNNNCDSCYNKSFASHEKSKNWSTKKYIKTTRII